MDDTSQKFAHSTTATFATVYFLFSVAGIFVFFASVGTKLFVETILFAPWTLSISRFSPPSQ